MIFNPSALVTNGLLLFIGILLGLEITLFFFIYKSVLEIIRLVRGDYYEEE